MITKIASAALVAATLATSPAIAKETAPAARSDCFFVSQWRSWSAPSEDVLLLKVRGNEIYRVELSAGSSQLRSGGNHLVSNTPTTVCSAIDLGLKVSDEHGHATPLIARSIARLTPEEIAAIPRADRP